MPEDFKHISVDKYAIKDTSILFIHEGIDTGANQATTVNDLAVTFRTNEDFRAFYERLGEELSKPEEAGHA